MGEFSDYFEAFPEEDPANWDKHGQYNPEHRAEAERLRLAHEKLDEALRRKGIVLPDTEQTKPEEES